VRGRAGAPDSEAQAQNIETKGFRMPACVAAAAAAAERWQRQHALSSDIAIARPSPGRADAKPTTVGPSEGVGGLAALIAGDFRVAAFGAGSGPVGGVLVGRGRETHSNQVIPKGITHPAHAQHSPAARTTRQCRHRGGEEPREGGTLASVAAAPCASWRQVYFLCTQQQQQHGRVAAV
jgi:hypothetical protein